MNKKTLRWSALFLLVFWMGLIFFFSSQPSQDSDRTSDSLIEIMVSAVYPKFNFMDLADKNFIVELFSTPIRKAAHFTEFFTLGAISFVYFSTFKFKQRVLYTVAPFLLGALYAVSDEIHQSFVSGRACKITDVYIDSAGVLLAVLFLYLIFLRGDRIG